MNSISYGLTASTEIDELPQLLQVLVDKIGVNDEIVLQLDEGNSAPGIQNLVEQRFTSVKIITFPLNAHFGNFKNNLKKFCSKDYILQLDADEIPNAKLLDAIPEITSQNPEIDLIHIPRANTVSGITDSHLEKWGWRLNEKGWVNWPDYQPRLIKNTQEIHWDLPVHEVIRGFSQQAFLPSTENLCLYHNKQITKQESQNQFYSNLS